MGARGELTLVIDVGGVAEAPEVDRADGGGADCEVHLDAGTCVRPRRPGPWRGPWNCPREDVYLIAREIARAGRRQRVESRSCTPTPTDRAVSRYYLTTSIPYPSGEPHVGHSFEMITADAMARYRRLRGQDVFPAGRAWTRTASGSAVRPGRRALTPRPTWIRRRRVTRRPGILVGVEFDDFVRTTEPRHLQTVREFYKRVFDSGAIYKGRYEGWYCVRCEAFYGGRGTCGRDCCPVHRVPS